MRCVVMWCGYSWVNQLCVDSNALSVGPSWREKTSNISKLENAEGEKEKILGATTPAETERSGTRGESRDVTDSWRLMERRRRGWTCGRLVRGHNMWREERPLDSKYWTDHPLGIGAIITKQLCLFTTEDEQIAIVHSAGDICFRVIGVCIDYST